MLKDLFTNRIFVGALAFFVLMIVSGTLYLRHIERQGKIELERAQERLEQWEARQKQTEKVPEGDTSQGGHFHANGTWHSAPHEMPSDEKIESDVEFKARVEKNAADTAAAKTARERNAIIIRRMEENPLFETLPHLFEDMYSFYKAHPDFDHETASPELQQKWVDAVYAEHAKMRAHADEVTSSYVPLVEVDRSPFIPNQGGQR